MKENNRVLFVGNGIAMQMGIAEKWDTIIEDIAKDYDVKLFPDTNNYLPNNMQIVIATNDNVDKAMAEFCEKLKAISLTDEQKIFGKKILSLPFDKIITTNYTYELEKSVKNNKLFRCTNPKDFRYKRSDMTLFGYIPINKNKKVWHIHGHACACNSVIIGHYYYGKLLSRIQQYISSNMKTWIANQKYGREHKIVSWVDSFLTDDVYMFGFGMDLCELDIWWLVCCKKRHFPDSKIYFYVPKWELAENNSRRLLMNAYGIIIREVECENHSDFYNIILDELSEI